MELWHLISSYLYPYIQKVAQWLAKLPSSPHHLHIWMFSPRLCGCSWGAPIASQTCMLVIIDITPHNLDQTLTSELEFLSRYSLLLNSSGGSNAEVGFNKGLIKYILAYTTLPQCMFVGLIFTQNISPWPAHLHHAGSFLSRSCDGLPIHTTQLLLLPPCLSLADNSGYLSFLLIVFGLILSLILIISSGTLFSHTNNSVLKI